MTTLLAAAAAGAGGAGGVGAATGMAAGVAGGMIDGPEWAAPMIRVKSLCTGCAGMTGADGGRLMFAPGIGVAEPDGDGGSGTTGGGPDQGLDGDGGGGGGGAAGRGATTRSMADVALGLAPLLPDINGAAGGGTGSGSTWVAPKILVNSPGAGALGAAGGGGGGGATGLGGGAAGLGGGGAAAAGGFGPLPGSRNRTEIDGTTLGSDLGSGLGSGGLAIAGGVHDTVGESVGAGAPRWPDATKMSVNPPGDGAGGADPWVTGATRSSHFPNESKSRIMRVTTTGAPSTFSMPSTRSRASPGSRSSRASIAERSDALS